MPWALAGKMSREGSPQAKSPLMDSHVQDQAEEAAAAAADHVALDIPDGSIRKHSWRLKYQDFITFTKKGNGSVNGTQDSFQTLINKANDWLQKNPDVEICNCETVTWMSAKPELPYDSDEVVLTKCVAENSTTYFRRGLRLWLNPRSANGRHSQTLCYQDFVPERSDAFSSLISKANKKLDSGLVEGKIITIETVNVAIINGNVDAAGTRWCENANDNSPYAFVLRVFYIREQPTKENIGIKDFIPLPGADGYEPFSQLIQKANKWLRDQTDVRVTNMQSVLVQKDTVGPHSETGTTCFYTVPGVLDDEVSEFFRILRVAYGRPTGEILTEVPIVYPFYFENFTPELVGPGREGSRRKERMERMKDTFVKITTFLKNADLEVICAETVINPMQMVSNQHDGITDEMKFLLTPRLYLTGQVSLERRSSSIRRSNTSSVRKKDRKPSEDHPGPIFLRHVTVGQRKYRFIAAFVTIFVAITIIVVLSIVYSNQSSS